MYKFYMFGMRLPITPEKVTMSIKGANKTMNLMNEGEINFLKTPGLTEISFDMVLPGLSRYSFSTENYKRPDVYLAVLEKVMTSKKPGQFIIRRGKKLFKTNMKVSLESYTIKEDAKDGPDITVSVTLKQYRKFATKVVKLSSASKSTGSVQTTTSREDSSAPTTRTYTVVKGDTLWAIAKKYYGNGAQYTKIVAANSSIKNPNLIYPGQVFTIP